MRLLPRRARSSKGGKEIIRKWRQYRSFKPRSPVDCFSIWKKEFNPLFRQSRSQRGAIPKEDALPKAFPRRSNAGLRTERTVLMFCI